MINDVPIDLNVSTEYDPTSLEGTLIEGMVVKVEGSMVDGRLIADEVESEEDEDEIEIEAQVSSVNTTDGSITLVMNANQSLTVPRQRGSKDRIQRWRPLCREAATEPAANEVMLWRSAGDRDGRGPTGCR